MNQFPLRIGEMHFVGIGGIGMSGIAEVLHNLGYRVRGSDVAENGNVRRLRSLGVPVAVGHAAGNIEGAAFIVVSTAIGSDNPELAAARAAGIPVLHRAEMLAELMRLRWSIACAGTHGKTTTTSMVAALLDAADLDPTVINGGIINAYGANARVGSGDWMVVEADESDGSFTRLPATVAVVTNIDPEHLDHHGSFTRLRESFRSFVARVPFYGFSVLCIDHPEVRSLLRDIPGRRLVSYGVSDDADVRGFDLASTATGSRFSVGLRGQRPGTDTVIRHLELPMYGDHNVSNALAAIAVAWQMGLDPQVIRQGLRGFAGVKRRFTRTGVSNGITVIDDYAHHPVEIAAVLKAARSACPHGRIIAVVQPHRYTRLANLFDEFCDCFSDADAVIVADVHAAGEAAIPGMNRDRLVRGVRDAGHGEVYPLEAPGRLAPRVAAIAEPGDYVVCLGAGSITSWAQALPGELDAVFARSSRTRPEMLELRAG